jgi:hypothetical protein
MIFWFFPDITAGIDRVKLFGFYEYFPFILTSFEYRAIIRFRMDNQLKNLNV